jgi:hypothetical protein
MAPGSHVKLSGSDTPLGAPVYAGLRRLRTGYWTVGNAARARFALARSEAPHIEEQ